MPKWACPVVSQVKKKKGPNCDQHGNSQVGVPSYVPGENKDGSQLGPTWECPSGSAQV